MSKNAQQTTQKTAFSVLMVDLLSLAPFYNTALCEALIASGEVDIKLAAISPQLNLTAYKKAGIHQWAFTSDLVSKVGIENDFIRRGLKSIEYGLNLFLLPIGLRFKKSKLVHLQWLPFFHKNPLEVWCLRRIKKLGLPLVYTVHNILPHDTGETWKEKYRELYHAVDLLICHTRTAYDCLIRDFDISPEKLHLVRQGPALHSGDKNSWVQEQRGGVLFFGTIKPYKGVEYLLESWAAAALGSRGKLVIAGKGDKSYLERILNRINRLGLQKSVEVHFGYISLDMADRFHREAEVVVFPYSRITQSAALLTAMAYGKAIIATDLEAFHETLDQGRAGRLAPSDDPASFGAAIRELLDSPNLRQSLGRRAQELAEGEYGWGGIAQDTIRAYRSVLSY